MFTINWIISLSPLGKDSRVCGRVITNTTLAFYSDTGFSQFAETGIEQSDVKSFPEPLEGWVGVTSILRKTSQN